MSVTRLTLLLLILGGVTLFALQNWLPVLPLVILGVQTQALPLAVWMVGAIAAGAMTTLVIAGLFRLSTVTAPARRRPGKRVTASAPNPPFTPPWNPAWEPQDRSPAAASSSYTPSSRASNPDDDWERNPNRLEEWEDWDGYQEPIAPPPQSPPPSTAYSSRTVIQEDIPPPVASMEEVEEVEEKEEWEDWEGYEDEDGAVDEDRSPHDAPVAPPRPIREVQPEPKTRYQAGSVYSYGYRDPSNSGVGRTESVYDADFRVITPPYRPDPEEVPATEDEDWDFEEAEDDRDRSRPRPDEDW
jgi:hypothetical protein